MYQTSHPVPVATAAPLLRLVLILVAMVAALAGVLVASSAPIGWLVLAFAVVAGPVAVLVEGRSASECAPVAWARAERTLWTPTEHAPAYREAA